MKTDNFRTAVAGAYRHHDQQALERLWDKAMSRWAMAQSNAASIRWRHWVHLTERLMRRLRAQEPTPA